MASSVPEPEPAPAETAPRELAANVADPRHYRGAVQLPGGNALEFFVLLDPAGESAISIPAQGLFEGPLDDVVQTPSQVGFSLSAVGATWSATLSQDAVTGCAFAQAGMELECTLESIDAEAYAAAKTPPRPADARASLSL